jgi:hypothetical protein
MAAVAASMVELRPGRERRKGKPDRWLRLATDMCDGAPGPRKSSRALTLLIQRKNSEAVTLSNNFFAPIKKG